MSSDLAEKFQLRSFWSKVKWSHPTHQKIRTFWKKTWKKLEITALKIKMTFENHHAIYNSRYIFKNGWLFHCHVGFRGGGTCFFAFLRLLDVTHLWSGMSIWSPPICVPFNAAISNPTKNYQKYKRWAPTSYKFGIITPISRVKVISYNMI